MNWYLVINKRIAYTRKFFIQNIFDFRNSVTSLCWQKILVTSAYRNVRVFDKAWGMSCIAKNNKGPNIDPWGTLQFKVPASEKHEDIIINVSNNSVFLLRKSIEIHKSLISSAPREFEWSPKRFVPVFFLRMLDSIFRNIYYGVSRELLLQLFLIGSCLFWSKIGKS